MFNKMILSQSAVENNIRFLKNVAGEKSLCIMVKANAYGHGLQEMVKLLSGKVQCFGVATQEEALLLRQIDQRTRVIVFGRVRDCSLMIERNIDFTVFSYNMLKEVLLKTKASLYAPALHLAVNSGMNRYGFRDEIEWQKAIKLLKKNNICPQGVFTHFSSLTTDKAYTLNQKKIFDKFLAALPASWKFLTHVGGGYSLFENCNYDMFRVGMMAYGYGHEKVKPIMKVVSEIVDVSFVKKGEHVGYLCSYTAQDDTTVAVVPIGYGDGLTRSLSNNLFVKVKGKTVKNVGNVCMDCFMIDVSGIDVKEGDKVEVFWDAKNWSELEGTSTYEVCTNFAKMRGERVIIE